MTNKERELLIQRLSYISGSIFAASWFAPEPLEDLLENVSISLEEYVNDLITKTEE